MEGFANEYGATLRDFKVIKITWILPSTDSSIKQFRYETLYYLK